MTLTVERPPAAGSPGLAGTHGAPNGGAPARRAMIRWAFRLFRREWRQQGLVLALITIAVAATILGAAIAVNSPAALNAGFGTAQLQATLQGSPQHMAQQVAAIEHAVPTTDVIENETLAIPGSIGSYSLLAQNPSGPYGTPMLQLVSGHYPSGAGEVAMTASLAQQLGLSVGDVWLEGHGAPPRTLVGIVQNPQSLLDEFALVAPGQVTQPSTVTVLFDASSRVASHLSNQGISIQSVPTSTGSKFSPQFLVVILATVGMLLIGLVAIGGFTVIAQRRLRSIGMVESLGATDSHVKLVVRANGAVVGLTGALLGGVLGVVAWVAYRPHLEQTSHHLISTFALPWVVVGIAMALGLLTAFFAASRPAATITRVPIVAALSGRPAPPKGAERSFIPGTVALVIAFLLLALGGQANADSNGGLPEVVLGFVALVIGIAFIAPLLVSLLSTVGRRAPVSVRLALRDLSRYRSRSGSSLAAISLGITIAVVICVVAAARYSDVLDYAGPNLANNQIVVYTAQNAAPGSMICNNSKCEPVPANQPPVAPLSQQQAVAHGIARTLGATSMVALEQPSANLQKPNAAPNVQWNGAIFVATPQLLRAFGISPSQIDPNAMILSSRPGLSTYPGLQLTYGPNANGPGGPGPGPGSGPGSGNAGNQSSCPPSSCIANPVIQEMPQLPAGTSAPNTVLTEHAIRTLHLGSSLSTQGWLITASQPITATQINQAQSSAASIGMTVESKNDAPSSWEVINWATAIGLLLALGVLAMSVGLIRAETAADLRTLTATGAGSRTRRSITAATAGALGLLGALIGTGAAYLACIAFFHAGNRGQSLVGNISHVPVNNLLLIIVGMPLVAAIGGWVFAGREPAYVSRQPIE